MEAVGRAHHRRRTRGRRRPMLWLLVVLSLVLQCAAALVKPVVDAASAPPQSRQVQGGPWTRLSSVDLNNDRDVDGDFGRGRTGGRALLALPGHKGSVLEHFRQRQEQHMAQGNVGQHMQQKLQQKQRLQQQPQQQREQLRRQVGRRADGGWGGGGVIQATLWLDQADRGHCDTSRVVKGLWQRVLHRAHVTGTAIQGDWLSPQTVPGGRGVKRAASRAISGFILCGDDEARKREVVARVGRPFVLLGGEEGCNAFKKRGPTRRTPLIIPHNSLRQHSMLNKQTWSAGQVGGGRAARRGVVLDACASVEPTVTTGRFFTNMIILEDKKLVICVPPKNGCSTVKHWVRAVLNLPKLEKEHMVHDRKAAGIKYLSDLSPDKADAILRDPSFHKIAILRDPVLRALSGFLNKFVLPNPVSPELWLKQLQRVIGTPRDPEIMAISHRLQQKPTLVDFVAMLERAMARNRFRVNEHFAPQADICLLPVVNYNKIVDFKHLTEEMNVLNDAFHLQTSLPTRTSHATNATHTLNQHADEALVQRIKSLFSMDMAYFESCCKS